MITRSRAHARNNVAKPCCKEATIPSIIGRRLVPLSDTEVTHMGKDAVSALAGLPRTDAFCGGRRH